MNWNGSARPTRFVSSSQLKAKIRDSDLAKASTALVTVTNPAPGGGISNVVFLPIRTRSSSISMTGTQVFANCTLAVVGDFNNDGKIDVAWLGSTLNVSLGNGDGTFQAPLASNITDFPFSQIITGDFNNDGKTDLAGIGESVAVYLGNGDGTFTEKWARGMLVGIII